MSVILRPAKRCVCSSTLIACCHYRKADLFRSELPFYCFPDGQPKSKKKAKRSQQPVSWEVPSIVRVKLMT
jgi:hypothetical protein